MTSAHHPPERDYDLYALQSLDPGVRNPVIMELSRDVTPRLKHKIRTILGHNVESVVIDELIQGMWERLIPKLRRKPKHGLVGFIITMQSNIALEYRRSRRDANPQLGSQEADNLTCRPDGGIQPTPSRASHFRDVQKAALADLEAFRSSIREAATAPLPGSRVDSPVLQMLALDLLVGGAGRDQVTFRSAGFSAEEASRLRRRALDRLACSLLRLQRVLGDQFSSPSTPNALPREALAPGQVLSDAWDMLGISCHRHPPAPFAGAHSDHDADIRWMAEVHTARCDSCASQDAGTAVDGEVAVEAVTRSLGL